MKYLTPTDRYDIEDFNQNFKELEDKINELEEEYPVLDTPEKVYAETRPSDWLPMPMPEDDELYMLFHVPEDSREFISFTVKCEGDYTVETGTVVNGAFVSQASTSLASGSRYEAMLLADDYGNLTSDGFKQVMIKVSGAEINSFVFYNPVSNATYKYNVVEFAARLPDVQTFSPNYVAVHYFALYGSNKLSGISFTNNTNLKTVLELDTSTVTSISFQACVNLLCLPQLDLRNVASLNSCFSKCASLKIIDILTSNKLTNIGYAFAYCSSLKSIPTPIVGTSIATGNYILRESYNLKEFPFTEGSFAMATDLSSMFYSCGIEEITIDAANAATANNMCCNAYRLKHLTILNAEKIKTFTNMCRSCYALEALTIEGMRDMTTINNMVSDAYRLRALTTISGTPAYSSTNTLYAQNTSLQTLRFDPTITGWGGLAINCWGCKMLKEDIVAFFNSLPVIAGYVINISQRVITLTGNPGVSELTDADKAIATEKGWTLTL